MRDREVVCVQRGEFSKIDIVELGKGGDGELLRPEFCSDLSLGCWGVEVRETVGQDHVLSKL